MLAHLVGILVPFLVIAWLVSGWAFPAKERPARFFESAFPLRGRWLRYFLVAVILLLLVAWLLCFGVFKVER
jgi:hypothetical protein